MKILDYMKALDTSDKVGMFFLAIIFLICVIW